jgi:hypothetical protein
MSARRGGPAPVVALLALALALPAAAEQFVEQDGFRVHYAALPTTAVTPGTARAFGIGRSSRRALIVLNAQRLEDGRTVPVPASATGTARSLIGHVQDLALRSAREGDVHYVLAEFQVVPQEWLAFELQVTPQGAPRPVPIRFRQQFYPD